MDDFNHSRSSSRPEIEADEPQMSMTGIIPDSEGQSSAVHPLVC